MKLLKVSSSGFMACEKEININFVPSANKYDNDYEYELNYIDEDLYTFTTMCVVGKNASGKTTMVHLLSIVFDILTNYRIKDTEFFLKYIDKPFNLDITFYHEGVIYRYLCDIEKDNNSINLKYLINNQQLYKRKYFKSHINELYNYELYKKVDIKNNLPSDMSILFNILSSDDLKGLVWEFDTLTSKNYLNFYNLYKLLDESNELCLAVLKLFDNHIADFEVDNDKFILSLTNGEKKELTNDELDAYFSTGTSKGYGLFNLIIYSLKTGIDIVIDELENHFHKTLVESVIDLYKSKVINKHGATLIFTTHYCELLDMFDRCDNIYITKNENKIMLENMYEKYKVRPDLSKSNKYYKNEFNTAVDYEALMKLKRELMK